MKRNLITLFALPMLAACPLGATTVSITQVDTAQGDILLLTSGAFANEMGDAAGGFPAIDQVTHSVAIGNFTVTSDQANDPLKTDREITITNMSTINITGLFYVINGLSAGGTFSNYDGTVNGARAVKIDSLGGNRPLTSESMTANNIFQPGETWKFVLTDYVSAPSADAFFSAGEVGNTDALPSLIVPEPTGSVLGLLGGLLLIRRRR